MGEAEGRTLSPLTCPLCGGLVMLHHEEQTGDTEAWCEGPCTSGWDRRGAMIHDGRPPEPHRCVPDDQGPCSCTPVRAPARGHS